MSETLREPDPDELAVARRVLNDDQYLTWAMAETGLSRQAIADYRGKSKGTINDTLRRARRLVENETKRRPQKER